MKKHLIAAAVAAVAMPAMAQVTVYGSIGAANTSTKTGTSTVNTFVGSTANDHWKTTAIGLRGSEDLGGGMKASFQFEGDTAANGILGGSDTNVIFNRFANVGISAGFGSLTLGRQNDSIQDLKGTGQFSNLSDNLAWGTSVGSRYNNMVKYVTPSFQGFTARVAYTDSSDNSQTDASPNLLKVKSYGLSGVVSGVTVAVATGEARDGSATILKSTYYGARTKVAAVELGAHYTTSKGETTGSTTAEFDQFMVSGKYSMGSVDVIGHFWSNDVTDATGAYSPGGTTAGVTTTLGKGEGSGYGLLAAYNLSKRTGIYAGFSDFDAEGTGQASRHEKVSTFGVFHSF